MVLVTPKPGIEYPLCWTMRHENGLGIEQDCEGNQIGLNLILWLLENAAHEWPRVLIADKGEGSKGDPAPVNRPHALRSRIQFNQIVVPHNAQNRHSGAVEQPG